MNALEPELSSIVRIVSWIVALEGMTGRASFMVSGPRL
jgi:hypothetical protein